MFKLSTRSLSNLEGVDLRLVEVVQEAITLTRVDFGVIEGVRTKERQQELYDNNLSQTMNSKHLTGKAVDLMAYVGGRACWELNVYDDIADAMREAAIKMETSIRWGCAWNLIDIRFWTESMEEAMNDYIDLRRFEGKRPFLDGPHFEISNDSK
jgi:peptidoglycan L-alanyl-D-glutamate endopeptidase CwlK